MNFTYSAGKIFSGKENIIFQSLCLGPQTVKLLGSPATPLHSVDAQENQSLTFYAEVYSLMENLRENVLAVNWGHGSNRGRSFISVWFFVDLWKELEMNLNPK